MEEKILKSSIFVNDTVFSDTVEQPIDAGFTLPDYCPDISKIFKCRAVSRISSKSQNGNSLTLDGVAVITLLYSDNMGELCSFEYQYPFNKTVQIKSDSTGGNTEVISRCDYINCRAVSGRKVDIHGAISIAVKITKRCEMTAISDIDDITVEQKRLNTSATVPMGYTEKYLLIEENIEIGQGKPKIDKILRYDAKPCVKESKLINDKIVVKGDMSVWLLYCPLGGGAPQSVKTVIPFSQIIEMEGVTDSCECDTKSEISFLEIKPNITENENTELMLTAKLLLTAKAYCGNEIPIISDAFSRKYKAEFEHSKIPVEFICDNINEAFHCRKGIELEASIASVSDIWCDMQSLTTEFYETEIIIRGVITASILTCDLEGCPLYFEKPIEFEYRNDLKKPTDYLHSTPEVDIAACGYTITGANTLELKIDLQINAAIYECRQLDVITEVKLDKDKTCEKNKPYAMTIYFTGSNELVWDIAKHYNSSVEEIMKINDLSGECIPENKMLLIPAM